MASLAWVSARAVPWVAPSPLQTVATASSQPLLTSGMPPVGTMADEQSHSLVSLVAGLGAALTISFRHRRWRSRRATIRHCSARKRPVLAASSVASGSALVQGSCWNCGVLAKKEHVHSTSRATDDSKADEVSHHLPEELADIDLSEADEYEALLAAARSADDGIAKYKVSLDPTDPIVQSLLGPRIGAKEVRSFELLESRWNGNELLKYETDIGPVCVKMNRVEPVQVFTAESLGLVTIAKVGPSVRVPKPLDIGVLPKVGDFGPGSFLVMEWIQAVPFAVLRSDNQKRFGVMVADMHLTSDATFVEVHKGRYGFPVNNWLSLNAQNNDWQDSWASFFNTRLQRLLDRAYSNPSYAGAAGDEEATQEGTAQQPLLSEDDDELRMVFADLCVQVPHALGPERLPTLRPALLHGDLWIGNVLADKEGPLLIDPACYFGHSEMELSIMSLFGGFTDDFYQAYHDRIPKADGFEERQLLYKAYHWLNQFILFGDPRAKDEAITLARQFLAQECD